jgi:hypothetical protein
MFKKSSKDHEEFVFYLDLTTEYLKKKNLVKSIGNFIKEREKYHSLNSYGLVMFQERENLITIYDDMDANVILKTINEVWDAKETQSSFFENGLFEVLAYIFTKSKEARKNYRVIVISDRPSEHSEEYHYALYDLLLKAKNFNTFIDIIRVGDEKFYSDDVKLKVITSETKGGLLYCNDPKLFPTILESLVQSKTEFLLPHTEENQTILAQDKIFYEKLAVDLISLDNEEEERCDVCQQELCPVCEAHSDVVHKCYNCGAKYHMCCAAKYAIQSNIGLKHLFRCIQCDSLLKLDEEFVEMIIKEESEEEEQESAFSEEHIGQEFIEPSLEGKLEEESIEQYPEHEDTTSIPQVKKIRIGGFFGQEIEIRNNEPKSPIISKSIPVVSLDEEDETMVDDKISITSLAPPKKKSIKLCKICGTTIRNNSLCPNCGSRVD